MCETCLVYVGQVLGGILAVILTFMGFGFLFVWIENKWDTNAAAITLITMTLIFIAAIIYLGCVFK